MFRIFLLSTFAASIFASSQFAHAQTLNGTGIAEAYASGCSPATPNDFMEKGTWNSRRIEPRDCAKVLLATPIFSWTMPMDAVDRTPMTLEIKRLSNSSVTSHTVTAPRFLHTTPMANGAYTWVVRYKNRYGQNIVSTPRRFTVGIQTSFTIPSGTDFVKVAAGKPHPRALPAGKTFGTIAAMAMNGEYRIGYLAFLERAQTLLVSSSASIPAHRTLNSFSTETEYKTWLSSIAATAGAEAAAIEILSFAAYFTGNSAYQNAAIDRLVKLAQWSPTGATGEATQDQANRKIYLALALGLDMFYSKLSEMDRKTIAISLNTRFAQVLQKFSGFDRVPYDSHLITATLYLTEAMMYVVGFPEFSKVSQDLASTWETMISVSGTWGGMTDGGFANATGYAWNNLVPTSRFLAAVRLITNLNLAEMPAFGGIGKNQIAFNAPGIALGEPFGNGGESERDYFDYSWQEYRLLASITRKPEYEWYWRVDPRNVSLNAALPAFHFLALGLTPAPLGPVATPSLPNSFLFEDAGLVAMHSSTTNPLRTSVFFRSSRFGSHNHSHADNNAFTFVSKGKALLINGGYYPYYDSPHHKLVTRATRFKNALTFNDGIGQGEPSAKPAGPGEPLYSMDARGRLINYRDNGTWAVSTGDATLAYRGHNAGTWTPLLTTAVRTVAYNRKEGVVVIYDYATSGPNRKWELNFQSLFKPALAGSGIKVINGTSSACIDVYGAAGSFTLTSGFPVNPEKTFTTQHHSRFTLNNQLPYMRTVTVIREDCRPVSIAVSAAPGDTMSVSIAGRPAISFARRSVTVPAAY